MGLLFLETTIDVELKDERAVAVVVASPKRNVIDIFVEGGGGSQFRLMRMALEYSLLTTGNCKKRKKKEGEDGKKGERQDGKILNQKKCKSFQSGKRMKPGKRGFNLNQWKYERKKSWGKRTMEEEKNKLLVLVTYTIKTCVMSPFFSVFMKEKRALLSLFCFMFVQTKKSDFQLQSYSSTTKSG